MADEIERKFLVKPHCLPQLSLNEGVVITQGYLSLDDPTVRVRIQMDARTYGKVAFLTVKGRGKIKRKEIESEILIEHALDLMDLVKAKLYKHRWELKGPDGKIWSLDLFQGGNGLAFMAEIELESEDEPFEKPEWVDTEVSEDGRYSNVNIAQYGFPS